MCVCVRVCAPVRSGEATPREGPERTSRPRGGKLDTPLEGPGSRRMRPPPQALLLSIRDRGTDR